MDKFFDLKKIIYILFIPFVLFGKEDPKAFYLSWVDNPSSSMVLQWFSSEKESEEIEYQKKGSSSWKKAKSQSEELSGSDKNIHKIYLTHLKSNTSYQFRFSEQGKNYFFRTMPDSLNTRPIRIVIGGDLYHVENLFKKMNRTVAKLRPDFIVLGGDIAYTEGFIRLLKTENWKVDRWQEFFEIWKNKMVDKEGYLIPLLAVVGNHDVKTRFDPVEPTQLFYQLFAFPEKNIPYRLFKVTKDIALFLLDSGHSYPIDGEQALWLKNALKSTEGIAYRFPIYHVAAYPSAHAFNDPRSIAIRRHWVPLFEDNGIQIVFENHNHAYKRTYPLRQGKVDTNGVVYLGDGSWGVKPRYPKSHWYLKKAKKINCVWLLTIDQSGCLIECFDIDGKKIDTVRQKSL